MNDNTSATTGSGIVTGNYNQWSLNSAQHGLVVATNSVTQSDTKGAQKLATVNQPVYYQNRSSSWSEWLNGNSENPLFNSIDVGAGNVPGSTPTPPVLLPAGPKPPSQAAAVGYNTATFDDEFNSPNDVSSSNTGIHDWYTYNGFDPTNSAGLNLTSSDYSIANGVLTISDPQGYPGLNTINTNNPAISTPASHAVNTGNGLAFQYGYFEASIKFNPQAGTTDQASWPAFWSSAVEALNGISPYSEIDFMEAYPDANRSPPLDLIGTVHQWYPAGAGFSNANNEITLPASLNLNDFNTYGVLWTSTSISWYINNQKIMSVPTTTATAVNTTGGETGNTNTFTTANSSHVYLQLGGPMQVDWVHVFQ